MLQVVGSERVILSDGGSILTITEAILSDVGLYTCNASNDHGTAEADDHRLLMVYCVWASARASCDDQQPALFGLVIPIH